jgi:hypothetical protein
VKIEIEIKHIIVVALPSSATTQILCGEIISPCVALDFNVFILLLPSNEQHIWQDSHLSWMQSVHVG